MPPAPSSIVFFHQTPSFTLTLTCRLSSHAPLTQAYGSRHASVERVCEGPQSIHEHIGMWIVWLFSCQKPPARPQPARSFCFVTLPTSSFPNLYAHSYSTPPTHALPPPLTAQNGMAAALRHDGNRTLKMLARSLRAKDVASAATVLDIMSVVCILSPETRRLVLDAFTKLYRVCLFPTSVLPVAFLLVWLRCLSSVNCGLLTGQFRRWIAFYTIENMHACAFSPQKRRGCAHLHVLCPHLVVQISTGV